MPTTLWCIAQQSVLLVFRRSHLFWNRSKGTFVLQPQCSTFIMWHRKFYRICGFSYFNFIFKLIIENWWLTSNQLLVLGDYIEDTHIFWLRPPAPPPPPPPPSFPKYRMLRGVNYSDFFYCVPWCHTNPQNCTYSEDFCRILLQNLAIVHPNVIKTL
jgi:hypothetical protein